MIAFFVSFLVRRGVSPILAKLALIIACLGLLGLAALLWIRQHDASVVDEHDAAVGQILERDARAADDQFHKARVSADRQQREERKDFDNASKALPDEPLTRRQRLDLCIELRDAGTDTTVIPQCADLRAGAATGTVNQPADKR